jgi:hypothetical protein
MVLVGSFMASRHPGGRFGGKKVGFWLRINAGRVGARSL